MAKQQKDQVIGRPKKNIDPEVVEKLASIMCTMNEIATFVGCSVDTLERRFADVIKRGQEKGRTSLRRFQYLAAEKGNTTMLIWLGKQWLNQKDKQEIEQTTQHNISPVDLKELADLLKDE